MSSESLNHFLETFKKWKEIEEKKITFRVAKSQRNLLIIKSSNHVIISFHKMQKLKKRVIQKFLIEISH